MINSRHLWIETGTSGAAAAQNIDHVCPPGQDSRLRYIYVDSSDGSKVSFTLERAPGTPVFTGYTPYFTDFGPDGFFVPGDEGQDVRLAIVAGAAGVVTKGYIMGIDNPRG